MEVGLQSLSLLKELPMERDKVYNPLLVVVLFPVEPALLFSEGGSVSFSL